MIVYKIDIMQALKDAGITTTKIRREKIFGEATLTKFRNNDTTITLDNLDRICKLLHLQPSEIIEYKKD